MKGDEPEFEGFEWDPAKSEATKAARGFGFETAVRIFGRGILETEDLRHSYGERRFVATGEAEGDIITVVWTPRGGVRRIVSAWPASNRERRQYRDYREIHERTNP